MNSFDAKSTLTVGERAFEIFRIDALQATYDVARLPFSLKVLLENLLRNEDGESIRKQDIEALASWDANAEPSKEIAFTPEGKRAIFGVSSIGGTSHLWSHYFMEKMGRADKVTWVQTGNVHTMLGSLKTKQVDVLSSAISVVTEAEKNGWGKVIYAPSDEKTWNAVIGGPVPVNVNFCLAATIEKEPENEAAQQDRAIALARAGQKQEALAEMKRYQRSDAPDRSKRLLGAVVVAHVAFRLLTDAVESEVAELYAHGFLRLPKAVTIHPRSSSYATTTCSHRLGPASRRKNHCSLRLRPGRRWSGP